MVFEAIEKKIRPSKSEPAGPTDKLTVEHLLPQGWKENDWPLPQNIANKDEATTVRDGYVPRIGNLTLATRELNSSMSNRSWETKRSALHSYSSWFLNKNLLDNAPTVWDETAIEDRCLQMAQEAIEIWPHFKNV